MKPGVSLQRTGCLPARSAQAYAASTAASSLRLGAHDLDERQNRRGVEEVHPDHALGPLGRLRDLGHGERGGVRGENRVGRAHALELREQFPLRLELLDDRLDHEVAPGEVGELGRRPQPPECGVALGRVEPALLDRTADEVRDPVAGVFVELVAHLAPDDLVPREHGDLRDARAHRPQADDTDGSDLPSHGARSYGRFEQVTLCYLASSARATIRA